MISQLATPIPPFLLRDSTRGSSGPSTLRATMQHVMIVLVRALLTHWGLPRQHHLPERCHPTGPLTSLHGAHLARGHCSQGGEVITRHKITNPMQFHVYFINPLVLPPIAPFGADRKCARAGRALTARAVA